MSAISITDNIYFGEEDFSEKLADVCDRHFDLLDSRRSPSWMPFPLCDDMKMSCSMHSCADQDVVRKYLLKKIVPLLEPFGVASAGGAEWWCNRNNNLGWHVDKDEERNQRFGEIVLPKISTVYYPVVDCCGGELLLLDSDAGPSIQSLTEYASPEYNKKLLNKIIRVPPKADRLVVFSPGIPHAVNTFVGRRYSLAVNIWENAPGFDWF